MEAARLLSPTPAELLRTHDQPEAGPAPMSSAPTPSSSSRKRKAPEQLRESSAASLALKELKEQLECTVCMMRMHSKIYQCESGHVICATCKPRLQNCASCRVPLGEIRNRPLEAIAAAADFELPCKFCDTGCTEVLRSQDRTEHEKTCAHRPYSCPLSASCAFTGSKEDLLEHLRTGHNVPRRQNFSKALLQSQDCYLGSSSVTGVLFTAESGDDMLFMWSQNIHAIQACILTFGSPQSHTYELKVQARGRKVMWHAPVRSIRDTGSTVFKSNDCLTIQQTLAGWISESPEESDELNITLDVLVEPTSGETCEVPPCLSQSAGTGRALNAVQNRLANIQNGVISPSLRRWLSSRGGWGRIELAASGGLMVGAAGSHSGFAVFSERAVFFAFFRMFQTIQGSFRDNLAKNPQTQYSDLSANAD